jgi:hypothetical protein
LICDSSHDFFFIGSGYCTLCTPHNKKITLVERWHEKYIYNWDNVYFISRFCEVKLSTQILKWYQSFIQRFVEPSPIKFLLLDHPSFIFMCRVQLG